MAVLKTSFRFPEINLGLSLQPGGGGGQGHLTPKIFLGWGAFDQRKGPHGGEFNHKKEKMSNARGSAGGGWSPLDLTHTL